MLNDRGRLTVEEFACGGWTNAASTALEQCDAKLGFKGGHLLTQGGLRHVQHAGRPGKTTGIHDAQEIAEMPKLQEVG
jgi:hypothetical protein